MYSGFFFFCDLRIMALNAWIWYLGCLSAPQEIDEYELVDPVDILTPLEKSGFWDGVVSALNLFSMFFTALYLPYLCASYSPINVMKGKFISLLLKVILPLFCVLESCKVVGAKGGCCWANQACVNKEDSSWWFHRNLSNT